MCMLYYYNQNIITHNNFLCADSSFCFLYVHRSHFRVSSSESKLRNWLNYMCKFQFDPLFLLFCCIFRCIDVCSKHILKTNIIFFSWNFLTIVNLYNIFTIIKDTSSVQLIMSYFPFWDVQFILSYFLINK